MDDALFVGHVQPTADLDHDSEHSGQADFFTVADDGAKVDAVQELHDQEVVAVVRLIKVGDINDIFMPDLAGGFGLLVEAAHHGRVAHQVAGQDLHRHALVDFGVLSFIHRPKATGPHPPNHAVAVDQTAPDEGIIRGPTIPRGRCGGLHIVLFDDGILEVVVCVAFVVELQGLQARLFCHPAVADVDGLGLLVHGSGRTYTVQGGPHGVHLLAGGTLVLGIRSGLLHGLLGGGWGAGWSYRPLLYTQSGTAVHGPVLLLTRTASFPHISTGSNVVNP